MRGQKEFLSQLLNERSKGQRLRLTLFARQAEECYLCIPTFYFPSFSRRVEKLHWKQHGPIFPLLCHTSSHLRCSQLSRLREEFVRPTFLTTRAFSPRFSTHTLALLLNLSFSPICTIWVKYAFYHAKGSILCIMKFVSATDITFPYYTMEDPPR